jgi:transcription termination/antitermination protein NusA
VSVPDNTPDTTTADDLLDQLLQTSTPERLHLATVTAVSADVVSVHVDGRDAILPASEWPTGKPLPSVGEQVRVVAVTDTVVSSSRTDVAALTVEEVVPDMWRGDVRVMGVARIAGVRTKVAVASTLPGLDAVAACVGRRAGRVQRAATLLNGERVDIIAWHEDPAVYIANALAPSSVLTVSVAGNRAIATVPEHQVATAVGAGGQNALLASQLTGYTITVSAEQ